MNIERLFLLNPYNDSHVEKLLAFEKENNKEESLIDIKNIRETISEVEYFSPNKNEFEEIMFTEKANKITDCCYIKGARDIKKCSIIPFNINNKNKRRHLPELAATYALDTLGMEEAYIRVDPNDNNMINYLELKGFENIGENNGDILLLKEKEEKENSQRMIS